MICAPVGKMHKIQLLLHQILPKLKNRKKLIKFLKIRLTPGETYAIIQERSKESIWVWRRW